MTRSMRMVLATIREYGAHTAAQLVTVTGYSEGTIAVALMRLQKSGWITKQGKIYRGAGKGSGAPQAIYAAVQA